MQGKQVAALERQQLGCNNTPTPCSLPCYTRQTQQQQPHARWEEQPAAAKETHNPEVPKGVQPTCGARHLSPQPHHSAPVDVGFGLQARSRDAGSLLLLVATVVACQLHGCNCCYKRDVSLLSSRPPHLVGIELQDLLVLAPCSAAGIASNDSARPAVGSAQAGNTTACTTHTTSV